MITTEKTATKVKKAFLDYAGLKNADVMLDTEWLFLLHKLENDGADLYTYVIIGNEVKFNFVRYFTNQKHAEFTFELLTQFGSEFTPF